MSSLCFFHCRFTRRFLKSSRLMYCKTTVGCRDMSIREIYNTLNKTKNNGFQDKNIGFREKTCWEIEQDKKHKVSGQKTLRLQHIFSGTKIANNIWNIRLAIHKRGYCRCANNEKNKGIQDKSWFWALWGYPTSGGLNICTSRHRERRHLRESQCFSCMISVE